MHQDCLDVDEELSICGVYETSFDRVYYCIKQQGWRKHFVSGLAIFESKRGATACVSTLILGGVWGHAPPEIFCNLQPLRLLLVASETSLTINIYL